MDKSPPPNAGVNAVTEEGTVTVTLGVEVYPEPGLSMTI